MRNEERLEAVKGCRWVDEVVPDVPYIMNEEYLNYVIKKYRWVYIAILTPHHYYCTSLYIKCFHISYYYNATGLITSCTGMTLVWLMERSAQFLN